MTINCGNLFKDIRISIGYRSVSFVILCMTWLIVPGGMATQGTTIGLNSISVDHSSHDFMEHTTYSYSDPFNSMSSNDYEEEANSHYDDSSEAVEDECTKETYNKTCCNSHEFHCADGYCVPRKALCDNKLDCPDNSDEFGCLGLLCSSRTQLKCEQLCHDLPRNRSRCICYKGYVLKTKGFKETCQDVNECEIGVHWCSHDCENMNGTFGCSCRDGFEKDNAGLPGACKANDQNIMVLYSSDAWIYGYSVDKHKISPVVHAGKVDEMDYDPATNMIYWSTRHRVARSYLPGAINGKVTVGHPQSVGPSSIWHIKNSLAIDWTAGNLYWISIDILNVDKYQILVSKLDGRYVKTLVGDVMFASSLVVDPESGKMYWTSGGENAEIGTAWMNGMYKRSLIKLGSTSPTALTLDHLSDGRLFWSDTKTFSIYSVYTDGTRLTRIITNSEAQSPLMLDVFESYLYWVTKESRQLVRRDKFGRGETVVLVEHLINQTSVKVYHKRRVEVQIRKAALYCRNQCSHLCLHVPRGYACSCPDGSRLLLLLGEILCDAEKEEPLEEPLICDCTNKEELCNVTAPYNKCHCPNVICGDGTKVNDDEEDYIMETTDNYDVNEQYESGFSPDEYHKIVSQKKWNRALVLFLCISPVFIAFALSFCKRPERGSSGISGSEVIPRSIGFSNQDSSVQEDFPQGGPTIVKKSGSTTRNNGVDNPLYQVQEPTDFQSTAQLLVH